MDLSILGPGYPTVAFRWLKDSEYSCPYSGAACWAMYMIPKDGCGADLFVTISIEDTHGTTVDSSVDSVGSIEAGHRARLVFNSFADGASAAHITDIKCY